MWLAREQLMEGFGGRKAKIFGNVKVLIKKSWKWISPPSPPVVTISPLKHLYP